MKIKKNPHEIWQEYERGISYNTGIDLYENVKRNNDFFNDKQWEGVNAPDLDKPVFNFLKPVVSYYVAMLISDDIAVSVELNNSVDPAADGIVPKIIAQELDSIIERTNMKFKNRRMLKNCAIDGDGAFTSGSTRTRKRGSNTKARSRSTLRTTRTYCLATRPSRTCRSSRLS